MLTNSKNSSRSKKEQVKSLINYLKKIDAESFATQCATTKGNILQIAYGGAVSAKLSKTINKESKGEVLLEELRPDIFS